MDKWRICFAHLRHMWFSAFAAFLHASWSFSAVSPICGWSSRADSYSLQTLCKFQKKLHDSSVFFNTSCLVIAFQVMIEDITALCDPLDWQQWAKLMKSKLPTEKLPKKSMSIKKSPLCMKTFTILTIWWFTKPFCWWLACSTYTSASILQAPLLYCRSHRSTFWNSPLGGFPFLTIMQHFGMPAEKKREREWYIFK